MIISASRIVTASGSGLLGAHVFSGPRNRSITVVQGSRAELGDMIRDARGRGAKYAVRHYKVSPRQATTPQDALAVAAALGREFGFDPGCGVLVEHGKQRQGGQGFDRHWHFMVPEVDPVRGRVFDAHWMRPATRRSAGSPRSSWGTTPYAGGGTGPWRPPYAPRATTRWRTECTLSPSATARWWRTRPPSTRPPNAGVCRCPG